MPIDDVLPAAGLAALSHVASHALLLDARLRVNSSFASEKQIGNERWCTGGTDCCAATDHCGAVRVGFASAKEPFAAGLPPCT